MKRKIFILTFFSLYLNIHSGLLVSSTCDNIDVEISSYQPIIDKIIESIQDGGYFKSHTYSTLSYFVDTFGPRMTGTKALENSIDYIIKESNDFGFNVTTENVAAPWWERNFEEAYLLEPWKGKIPLSTLGGSVSTPDGGIIAEIVAVKSFKDLVNKSQEVKGKVVIFNEDYVSYGETVKYRSQAASIASKYGAIATLIRSITPFSIATPHTGHQSYDPNVKKIPTACIPPEYSAMLYRMYKRQRKGALPVKISLKITTNDLGLTTTRNTFIDYKGRESPEKYVIVSGHIDSWDVGQGAMDDGSGAFISWNSLILLKSLNLKPRRTIRGILWSAEEQGLIGAAKFLENHMKELKNIILAMESDEGTFTPRGIQFSGSTEAACIMRKILKLFKSINATELIYSKNPVGSDIVLLRAQNVSGAALLNENQKYFWYHHSAGDMLTVLDSNILDLCTALWAGVAYVVADMSIDLPKITTE